MASIFLGPICLLHILTILSPEAIVLGFLLKVASTFLDLVCSVHIVPITTEVSFKSGLHIFSGTSMFSTYSDQYNWGMIFFCGFTLKLASIYPDRVCLVHVATNSNEEAVSKYIHEKWLPFFSGPIMFGTYCNHYI